MADSAHRASTLPSAICPVILCGGAGARLWPVSRAHFPKQLASFTSAGSLLQNTLRRVGGPAFARPLLVTAEDQRFLVRDQVQDIGFEPAALILEQQARNTAPAVALAAEWLSAQSPDALMLVLPSDHAIDDEPAFRAAVQSGISAAGNGKLVTFGIMPTRPETGFGYIKAAQQAGTHGPAVDVLEFVEKPPPDQARAYLESGDYFWNSGIILCRPHDFLAELATHAPEIAKWAREAVAGGAVDGSFFRPGGHNGLALPPSISVDHAVMERSKNVAMVPANVGWSDLGSWSEVWTRADQDPDGNACKGNALPVDTKGTLIYGLDDVTVATLGVQDLVVVSTHDALLVAARDRAQDVRKVVDALKARDDPACKMPDVVHRAWGTYQIIGREPGLQTRRVVVNPGAQISLQMHRQRSEHWIVVSGTAEVTIAGEASLIHSNQSVSIPAGTVHRLANPGPQPLLIVEVQCGSNLQEEDVVRFED